METYTAVTKEEFGVRTSLVAKVLERGTESKLLTQEIDLLLLEVIIKL